MGGNDDDTLDGGVDRAPTCSSTLSTRRPRVDRSDVIRNLDVDEDVLRLESGLTDPVEVDPLITVQDDGTDTTLRFADRDASITLIGVTGPDLPFGSVSDLVNNDIVFLV